MISVLCVIPGHQDATSFYRAIGPLSMLKRQRKDLNLVFLPKVDWTSFKMTDLCFMQRPFRDLDVQVSEMARKFNKPLWVDLDDDLFDVPEENPTHVVYGRKETKLCIAKVVANADIVTVSTPLLKNKIMSPMENGKVLNRNVVTVPNALDDEWIDPNRTLVDDERKLVVWRGSTTHQKDLYIMKDEILSAAWDEKYKDWLWAFVGYNPWFITQEMPKGGCVHVPPMDIHEFFLHMGKIQAAIQIVPLTNNDFNKSKSNIAWIEGSYGGSAVLGPDWDEWKRPGLWNYKSVKDFGVQLRKMLDEGPDSLRKNHANLSWDFIKEKLCLSKINNKRAKIVDALLSGQVQNVGS